MGSKIGEQSVGAMTFRLSPPIESASEHVDSCTGKWTYHQGEAQVRTCC